MRYLEKIKPSYFDLLMPLLKWKILNVQALKQEAEYSGSSSAFYKIISKLENNLLLDSFINSWSNEKFVYLLPEGIRALGENERRLSLNRDLRFHDSIVSKVARKISDYPFINEVYLDFQLRDEFPLLERVPDCIAIGELDNPLKMAIEVELTQKSQDRVKQILRTYSDSKVVNNILYITDKMSVFNSYTKYIEQLEGGICKEKFLVLLDTGLVKSVSSLESAPVWFKNNQTNLKTIFKEHFTADG